MRRNIIRLNESQLHRVIKESVRRVLGEDIENGDKSAIIWQLSQLEDKLVETAIELRRVYFQNERWFEKYGQRYERMGLDNPPFSHGTQGELSNSFDEKTWKEWVGPEGPSFKENWQMTYDYYSTLQRMADAEGYGLGAMARGFDVTRPSGLIWTYSTQCLHILNKMKDIAKIR